MIGDPGAHIAIGNPAGFIDADMLFGIVLRWQDARAAGAAKAACGDRGALKLQEPFGNRPTAIQLSDQLVFWNFDVGEEGFAERR